MCPCCRAALHSEALRPRSRAHIMPMQAVPGACVSHFGWNTLWNCGKCVFGDVCSAVSCTVLTLSSLGCGPWPWFVCCPLRWTDTQVFCSCPPRCGLRLLHPVTSATQLWKRLVIPLMQQQQQLESRNAAMLQTHAGCGKFEDRGRMLAAGAGNRTTGRRSSSLGDGQR